MVIINGNTDNSLEWTIFKGLSGDKEDFTRSEVALFAVSKSNKIPLAVENKNGSCITALIPAGLEIPTGLTELTYNTELIWIKNGRDVNRTYLYNVFKVSRTCRLPEQTVKILSISQVYGYDGLSAYEMSVFKGKTAMSEDEWLTWQNSTTQYVDSQLSAQFDSEFGLAEDKGLSQKFLTNKLMNLEGLIGDEITARSQGDTDINSLIDTLSLSVDTQLALKVSTTDFNTQLDNFNTLFGNFNTQLGSKASASALNDLASQLESKVNTAYLNEQLALKINKEDIQVDGTHNWLKVNGENNKKYLVDLQEVLTPNAPTISITTYSVVTGNVNVAVTNNSPGATMMYKIDNGATWNQTTGTITLASGFSNDVDNTKRTYNLQVKAVMTGEESTTNEYSILIVPKVAPASISVSRSPNNNNYATSATITLTPSVTKGATSEYSVDGGNIWTVFNNSVQITVQQSVEANRYQVRATKIDNNNHDNDYNDANVVKNSVITLNAPKCYYGVSSKDVLDDLTDIQALADNGGGSVEAATLVNNTQYIVSVSTPNYVWICCTDEIDPGKIYTDPAGLWAAGFNAAMPNTINGYHCYRSEYKWVVNNFTLYYINNK